MSREERTVATMNYLNALQGAYWRLGIESSTPYIAVAKLQAGDDLSAIASELTDLSMELQNASNAVNDILDDVLQTIQNKNEGK